MFDDAHDLPVQEREMEMRRQALEEERRRREELEKRLQEETSRRQRLVEREVKLREKQRSQVFTGRRLSSVITFGLTVHTTKQGTMFIRGGSFHSFFYSPGC